MVGMLAGLLLILPFTGLRAAERVTAAPDAPAFPVEEINPGLKPLMPGPHLATPQATLEHFVREVGRQTYGAAAHALDLRFLPADEQAERAPELARQLAYLLKSQELVDWSEVPDRPDARVTADGPGDSATFGRRTIQLGELELDGHAIPINLQRFKLPDGTAVWLFSPFTVEHVAALYEQHGPGVLVRSLPSDLQLEILEGVAVWEWGVLLVLLAAAWFLGRSLHGTMRAIEHRAGPRLRFVTHEIATPAALAVAATAFHLTSTNLLPLAGRVTAKLDILTLIVTLVLVTWFVLRLISALLRQLTATYVTPLSEERHEARQIKTQARIAERVMVVLAGVAAIAGALAYLGVFDSLGLSLLASAGAVTVILSFAAQPLLGNLIAGIQIAASKPIRIGDVVEYEGHWARVEDITFTYSVFRTWTEKRLIVPHIYLLDKPLQNWSKHDETITRIIQLFCDHQIDVDALREHYEQVLDGDPRWTGSNRLVEVNEVNVDGVEIWCWVSGRNSSESWSLHNDVREQLLKWLQGAAGGRYLPKRRLIIDQEDEARPAARDQPEPEPKPDQSSGHPEAA